MGPMIPKEICYDLHYGKALFSIDKSIPILFHCSVETPKWCYEPGVTRKNESETSNKL